MGGEELVIVLLRAPHTGLPPRGRGRALTPAKTARHGRITPAWAGKSSSYRLLHERQMDYPRVGGEEFLLNLRQLGANGLPPRGRGRDRARNHLQTQGGITPAWAGKSDAAGDLPDTTADYPRVGGEESKLPVLRGGQKGLPPRGRGRASMSDKIVFRSRITPAWAGKSLSPFLPSTSSSDYPRVGGEESLRACSIPSSVGLPPRGRGRGLLARKSNRLSRITPAWAGKRDKTEAGEKGDQDYPRVGGEEIWRLKRRRVQ